MPDLNIASGPECFKVTVQVLRLVIVFWPFDIHNTAVLFRYKFVSYPLYLLAAIPKATVGNLPG